MKHTLGLVLTVVLLSALQVALPTAATASTPRANRAAATTGHYISNLHDSTAPRKLGYNIFDTGSSSREIRSLPKGVKALVWLGQKCPTAADRGFRRTVDRLAKKSRVFGYYLSDEPHLSDCPGGPAALASRARYIRQASDNKQRSFIVLSEDEDYAAFRPARTKVSLVGLDPYPCSTAHPTCDVHKINEKVRRAMAAGIPVRKMVPVYQVFGQDGLSNGYYHLPTAAQMQAMLDRWSRLVPHPQMDYSYSWGNQSSSNPTLVDSASLQRVFKRYFDR